MNSLYEKIIRLLEIDLEKGKISQDDFDKAVIRTNGSFSIKENKFGRKEIKHNKMM